MSLTDDILKSVPDGAVESVIVGLNWTGVTATYDNQLYCGLSSTLRRQHAHGKEYDVPNAGNLSVQSAHELASLCKSGKPTLASIGTAALNALLQKSPLGFVEKNAEEIITQFAPGKHVAIVGHFPFINPLRKIAGRLDVLENNPQPGDLHASQAQHIIPAADVVAITGMTFTNQTLEGLLDLCRPQSIVIILGASTPLSPVLFEYGVDYLCGALTVDVEKTMSAVAQGAVYPQIARAGLKLVTIQRSL